ncbi:MAG: DegQ family serine endoprotease [Gammaproteobacteria bacterium]
MPIRMNKAAWAAAGIFTVGAVTGLTAPQLLHNAAAPQTVASAVSTSINAASVAAAAAPIPLMTAPNYRAIVAQNQAAVVGISIVGEQKVANRGSPRGGNPFGGGDDDNDPFSFFFRNMPHGGQNGGTVPVRAQGSGFIISADGIILSNAHVVENANEVTVKLSDHREFKAKVLGSDKTSDIAVLKIDAKALPTVRIGNSDSLSVGDYVLAIGQPFGLEETATAGIVSATSRALPGDGYVPFIQTDAAVNPGNSGGPLFDSSGAVVGINSQIYSNSGGYQGVSFAIPINLAQQVQQQIVKTGKVAHGRLGVHVQPVDQSLADSFGLNSPAGALVSTVEPDSAAAEAGLKAGDVILEYNGAQVKDSAALSMRVNTTAPGEKAKLDIWRDGKQMTLTAKIRSADEQVASADDHSGGGASPATLGLTLRPLTRQEREQTGVASGLVVENAEGKAAQAGIQEGDVLLGVDGTPVESVAQLRKLVQEKHKRAALLIQRGDDRLFVPIALS